MTKEASWPLQEAVYQHLKNNAPLMERLNDIYDHVPKNAPYPYGNLGASNVQDWSSKTFAGQDHRFEIHLWSQMSGHREIKELLSLLYDALHEAEISLVGHELITLRFEFAQMLREDDGPLHHAVVRFRALTRAQAA